MIYQSLCLALPKNHDNFTTPLQTIWILRADSFSFVSRELINQFLREWDGMNNLSAFIMVATNRPFDRKCTFLKQRCPPDVLRIVLL